MADGLTSRGPSPCIYSLTGIGWVNYVVTDLALSYWQHGRFVLEEVAPGFSPDEVLELAEMEISIGPSIRSMDSGT